MEKPGDKPDFVSVYEELMRYINNLERQIGGYLYGRGMYENNRVLWATAGTQSKLAYEVEFAQIWRWVEHSWPPPTFKPAGRRIPPLRTANPPGRR